MDFQTFMSEKIRREFAVSEAAVGCGCREAEAVYVPMRDGVRLHTWMTFPEEERETYPVILTRTCYPNNDFMYRIYGEELAKRGYVFVWQYARGREQSEGDWVPNLAERDDGIDTVNWLVGQTWCGRLGYWGMSYTSMTGWAMADAVEGKVTSMYLAHYGTDRFVSAYEKGCFRHDVLTSWSMENGPVETDCSYERYLESCRYRPQSQVDEALWGGRNETYREYIASPNADAPLWQSSWWRTLREIPERTRIPLCVVSGWYDHHHGSTMKTWERLSQEAKAHSRLVVGAWNHFMAPVIPGREITHLHPEEIPPMLQWFEETLKQGREPERAVRCYLIGEDCWEEYEAWPPAEERSVSTWYLAQPETAALENMAEARDSESREEEDTPKKAAGAGNDQPTGEESSAGQQAAVGSLIEETIFRRESPATAETSYVYDPADPVPSVGGEGLLKTMAQVGSLPQPEMGARADVVHFVSAPLEEDLRIFGKIGVTLYVRSDCEDTAFTAKLIDALPDGTAYYIRSSITTIAQDLPEGETYHPGDVVKVNLSMWEIAYTVKAGHRLRLDVSSSNFPQFHVHSNYAGPWAEQTRTRIAHQTVLSGTEFPSCVRVELHA